MYRDGIPLCKLHNAREERPSAKGKASKPRVAKTSDSAPWPGPAERPDAGAPLQASPPQPQDVADVVTELLPGRTLAEAYRALSARAPARADPRPWGHPEFQRAVEAAGEVYLGRAQQDGLEDTPAYAALQGVARGAIGEAPAPDPVLSLPGHAAWTDPAAGRGPAPARRCAAKGGAPAAAGLFRPRTSEDGRGPRPASGPGTLSPFPGAVSRPSLGLDALRPHHAGAYTEPSLHHLDETSKALQTIAKAMLAKDEPAAQDRGKLSSIGRTEERMLFLARGCDTLTVHLGEATVGKDLFHALRNLASQNRPLLREVGFPVNLNNRIAFGFASLSLGGKGALPDYSLSVADFPPKCLHSHVGPAPKWDSLDWSVQLQLLRRGGHPARPKLRAHQVDAQVEAIRKDQAAKHSANVAEGQRQKAQRESRAPKVDEPRQDTRAGWTAPPEDLAGFHPTGMEEPLRELFKGAVDQSWTADHAPAAVRTAVFDAGAAGPEATAREARMQQVESSSVLPDAQGLLGTYLRNRILNLSDREATPADVQEFLEQAVVEGSPELAAAATEFLEQHPGERVGSSAGRAKLSPVTWEFGLGSGTLLTGKLGSGTSETSATSCRVICRGCSPRICPNRPPSLGSAFFCT